MAHVEVRHNAQRHRYEVWRDGKRAGHAQYRLAGDVITFIHTEVDQSYRGEGLASTMIQWALDDVRVEGSRRVVARCPMVRTWIQRHPDYQELTQRGAQAADER